MGDEFVQTYWQSRFKAYREFWGSAQRETTKAETGLVMIIAVPIFMGWIAYDIVSWPFRKDGAR